MQAASKPINWVLNFLSIALAIYIVWTLGQRLLFAKPGPNLAQHLRVGTNYLSRTPTGARISAP